MKRKMILFTTISMASAGLTFGADAAGLWATNCASCHAKDGSGSTMMGKKLAVKDYRDAKVQSAFSDADMTRAIKDGVKEGGKEKMKAFGGKLSDADVKALVAYVRGMKK